MLQKGDKFDLDIEHSLPFLILSPNLVIRPLIKEDKTQMFEALRDNLKMLHMWMPWSDETPTANEFISIGESFFTESNTHESIHYVVYRDEKLIGMCSLSNYNKKSETARLGFWCNSASDNQIIFLEAINAMLQYTFKNTPLSCVYIPCVVGNFTSERYAKELNFKLSSIEIAGTMQIKLFKIENHSKLPALDIHWVKNDAELTGA